MSLKGLELDHRLNALAQLIKYVRVGQKIIYTCQLISKNGAKCWDMKILQLCSIFSMKYLVWNVNIQVSSLKGFMKHWWYLINLTLNRVIWNQTEIHQEGKLAIKIISEALRGSDEKVGPSSQFVPYFYMHGEMAIISPCRVKETIMCNINAAWNVVPTLIVFPSQWLPQTNKLIMP